MDTGGSRAPLLLAVWLEFSTLSRLRYNIRYNIVSLVRAQAMKVKVTNIGNSMGIVLPKEALHKLKADKGDTLYLVEGADGYILTAYEQNFQEQMDAAKGIMKRYKNTLKELAK